MVPERKERRDKLLKRLSKPPRIKTKTDNQSPKAGKKIKKEKPLPVIEEPLKKLKVKRIKTPPLPPPVIEEIVGPDDNDPTSIINRKSPNTLAREQLYKEVEEKGAKGEGKKEYLKFLKGEPITPREGQKAKCYDCMSWFLDGKIDCINPLCPLYPFFIYNKTDTSQKKGRG